MRKFLILCLLPSVAFSLNNSDRLQIVKEVRQKYDETIRNGISWHNELFGMDGKWTLTEALFEVPNQYLVPEDFPIKEQKHLKRQSVTVYAPFGDGFRAGVDNIMSWAAGGDVEGIYELKSIADWWWVLLEDRFVDNDGGGLLVNFNPDSVHYGKMAALWTTDEIHFVVLEANYRDFYKELQDWNDPENIFTCYFSNKYETSSPWGPYTYARHLVDPRVQYPLAYVELRDKRQNSHTGMVIPKTMSRTFSITSSGIEKDKTPHALLGLVVDAKAAKNGSIKMVQGAAFEMVESGNKREEKFPFDMKYETLKPGKNKVARFELEYGYANMVSINNNKEYEFFHPLWESENYGPNENPVITEKWASHDWDECDLAGHYPQVCPAIKKVQFIAEGMSWEEGAKEMDPGINYTSFLKYYPNAEPVSKNEASVRMSAYIDAWKVTNVTTERFKRSFKRDWTKKLSRIARVSDLVFCDKDPSIWNGFSASSKGDSQRCYYVNLDNSTVTLVQHGEG